MKLYGAAVDLDVCARGSLSSRIRCLFVDKFAYLIFYGAVTYEIFYNSDRYISFMTALVLYKILISFVLLFKLLSIESSCRIKCIILIENCI